MKGRNMTPFTATDLPSSSVGAGGALMPMRVRRGRSTVLETATPERLLRAGGMARIETFDCDAERPRGNRPAGHAKTAQRIRIEDSPLTRLQSRGLLATGSDAKSRNTIMGATGERYYATWYAAGLQPLRSPDLGQQRVSGAQGGLLRTERQVANFHAFGRAAASLSADVRRVVDAVVLHEREPADIGHEMSGYRQEKQATAVGLYLLRAGLADLALHYGLVRSS